MSVLLEMRNVVEAGRVGPLSADGNAGEIVHLSGQTVPVKARY